MSEKPVFDAEERKLLETPPAPAPAVKPKKKEVEEPSTPTVKRGDMSPAQHDDDGWGDTPVQMRG